MALRSAVEKKMENTNNRKTLLLSAGEKEKKDFRRSSTNDEKAAAVERSLTAATYLLQNWGFANRTSLKRRTMEMNINPLGKVHSKCINAS